MRQRLGGRVQKLAIGAGLGCPNRDGTIANGGCTFCLGEAFSPSYCRQTSSITQQIDRALEFHSARRRNANVYLAYFQSGSNTYAAIEHLNKLYLEALSHPAISGIIVGTRPDCINSDILQLLGDISQRYYVAVEYGIESVYDVTLSHVNRGHDFATAKAAITATKALNIDVGAHFILGLPNESREAIIEGIHHINALDIDFIKFHQLQIYTSTPMAKEWEEHPERFMFTKGFDAEAYTSLIIDIIRRLKPTIAIERIASEAPRHLIAHSPLGGVRPDKLRDMLIKRMGDKGFCQGDLLIRE